MLRKATAGDLPRMEAAAAEFYRCSKFFDGFEIERFTALWSGLIESGAGVIFLLAEGDEIAGAIGGVAVAEPYSPALVASEFFWFVREQHRGGGLRLYRAFEDWAREQGCTQLRMCHMTDSMPERLCSVYERLGFEPAEIHYVKEL